MRAILLAKTARQWCVYIHGLYAANWKIKIMAKPTLYEIRSPLT
jgi:hypothetical protein